MLPCSLVTLARVRGGDDAGRDESGLPGAIIEIGTPDCACAAEPCEQQLLRDKRTVRPEPRQRDRYWGERLHVPLKDVRHAVRQGNVTDLVPLRRREHETFLRHLHLVGDVQPPGVEADFVDWKPEDFPLPKSAPTSEVDRRAVALWQRCLHCEDTLCGPRHNATGSRSRGPHRLRVAGVLRQVAVVNSGVEDRRHVVVDHASVRRGGNGPLQLAEPVSDVFRLEGAERSRAEVGDRMATDRGID